MLLSLTGRLAQTIVQSNCLFKVNVQEKCEYLTRGIIIMMITISIIVIIMIIIMEIYAAPKQSRYTTSLGTYSIKSFTSKRIA